ncbi:sugar ABC transporter permease [Cellulomonas sp. CW35]|uniref:Sugar ABC transporter permease n=1 Tax=Cellulomonas uda TaxID=1714 RepID=A0A4Y3K9M6_CELUD|nr:MULTISPECIES: sugar ABC transporter permease [Cellulomonas]ASR54831.1 sugar ABC transporter permease [Cellulomonas sp. PSBB021]NII65484.1 arabinogalactan oligomer/maltooligosaccharide transport system permease protein [Cellulomonas uda]GEA81179.1 sugar ABC transporter permease [Cellulomonas uda]
MTTTQTQPGRATTNLRRSGTHGRRWWREVSWRYLVALVMIVICVTPLLYVISASLNPGGSLVGSNRLFRTVSGENFADLEARGFWTWLGNSLVVCSVTAIGTVLMGAAAAYAFSRFRFKGREKGLTGLLLAQMFPQTLAFVAIFLLLLTLKDVFPALGLDSLLGLIFVYLGGALGVNTFLMYGFFNTVPRELDEAAKMDGATHGQIYWTIILRMVTPILAVVGLLSFISSFGDFLIAKVVLQRSDHWTVAVGLYSLAADERTAPWGLFAAGAVVAAVPVVLLFMFLQKYIVGGLTAGSVKG